MLIFVLPFSRNNADDNRDSFSHYYVPNVTTKLIDGKIFFDLPVKNEDYTTGNLLDFIYFKENYKLISIDFSKQAKLKDPQQISFIEKLKNQDHGATMFFTIEKLEETTFNFSKNSVTII